MKNLNRLNGRGIIALIAVALQVGMANPALADKCKNPDLRIKNKTNETIRVKNFQYFDGCDKKWRTESVKNKVISPGESVHYGDDLEYVEGCTVPKIIVNYEVDYANDFKAGVNDAKEVHVERKKNGDIPRCVSGANLIYALTE